MVLQQMTEELSSYLASALLLCAKSKHGHICLLSRWGCNTLLSLFFFLLNKFFWLSFHMESLPAVFQHAAPSQARCLGILTPRVSWIAIPWLLHFCQICDETCPFCCPSFLFLTFTEDAFDVRWERHSSITYWELNHACVALMKTRWVLTALKKAKLTDKIC